MKVAVIGVGYLGKFHAQKYANLEGVKLIGVCDSNLDQAKLIAKELKTKAFSDYQQLADKVDAVSIVTPTQLHFQIAKYFLTKKVHVLVEKPITSKVVEADELIKIAQDEQLILQVGHLERFNPALMKASELLDKPSFIETQRLSSFNPRGADVNVILDLMIHDIDIIQNLLACGIKSIKTIGVPVLTKEVDICNARLEFDNGCVANVSASRVSSKSERKMRIFQENTYMSVDFQEKTLSIYRNESQKTDIPDQTSISSKIMTFNKSDAILDEIISFIETIKAEGKPVVSGIDGRAALLTALEITEKIKQTF